MSEFKNALKCHLRAANDYDVDHCSLGFVKNQCLLLQNLHITISLVPFPLHLHPSVQIRKITAFSSMSLVEPSDKLRRRNKETLPKEKLAMVLNNCWARIMLHSALIDSTSYWMWVNFCCRGAACSIHNIYIRTVSLKRQGHAATFHVEYIFTVERNKSKSCNNKKVRKTKYNNCIS